MKSQERLITVAQIQGGIESAIRVKDYLEFEGIFVHIKNLNSRDTLRFVPIAGEDPEIQVKKKDVNRAVDLLIEGNFIKEDDFKRPHPAYQVAIFLDRINFLPKKPTGKRVIWFFVIISLIMSLPFLALFYNDICKTPEENIVQNTWYIESVFLNGAGITYYLYDEDLGDSINVHMKILQFYDDGFVDLINQKARWYIVNDSLTIKNAKGILAPFNANYYIDLSKKSLQLRSDSISIFANVRQYPY